MMPQQLPIVRPQPSLTAAQLAETPRVTRRIAAALGIAMVGLPFGLALVPWTQTSHGAGRAIAFNPVQRPQFVVSPIEGRIKKWFVVEGQKVKAGERIVEMVDNDPNLLARLLDEERLILVRLAAAEGRVGDIQARKRSVGASMEAAIGLQQNMLQAAQFRVQEVRQLQLVAKAALEAARPNLERQRELFKNEKGSLVAARDFELAQRDYDQAIAQLKLTESSIRLAEAFEKGARDGLTKAAADKAAAIASEDAALKSATQEAESVRREKLQIETRIGRQMAQYVDAPTDGTIFRLLANAEQGGQLVRPGERLAVLVPDVKANPKQDGLTPGDYPAIVAELSIDGNDLPLVRVGDKVRLQFEGWPAVQFVGWPSVAVGTFGGRVYIVDPTSDDKGRFRLLIEPDPDDRPWPGDDYLRQGVRAQGWVLLNRVSVGWELWRQLNGFPPTREQPESKEGRPLGPVGRKGG